MPGASSGTGSTGWITVRGGYQFATRAPNIAELFTAPTSEVVGYPDQDPCSVTTLVPWGNVPGNPNRLQVQSLCRAIIDNNTSGFDTQTYSITGNDKHRQAAVANGVLVDENEALPVLGDDEIVEELRSRRAKPRGPGPLRLLRPDVGLVPHPRRR